MGNRSVFGRGMAPLGLRERNYPTHPVHNNRNKIASASHVKEVNRLCQMTQNHQNQNHHHHHDNALGAFEPFLSASAFNQWEQLLSSF